MNYYNEFDPKAAAWLRELIKAGHIPNGEVDERSINEVKAHEISEYTQHHFFAGIGGWSLALRLAGWPPSRPVWTGSCPCQPFSNGGHRKGVEDERHLWPAWATLISQFRPTTVFGEQVASKDSLGWLDGVFADMEKEGYACGASDLCAASIGAPQTRQRLFWVAYAMCITRDGRSGVEWGHTHPEKACRCGDLKLCACAGYDSRGHTPQSTPPLENTGTKRLGKSPWEEIQRDRFWHLEPQPSPLDNGLPGHMELLRGYGNAIVPQVAAEFIQACEEAIADERSDVLADPMF